MSTKIFRQERACLQWSLQARLIAVSISSVLFVSSLFSSALIASAQTNEVDTVSVDRLQCAALFEGTSVTANVSLEQSTVTPGSALSGTVEVGYAGDMPLYGMNVYAVLVPEKGEGQVLTSPARLTQLAEDVMLDAGFQATYPLQMTVPQNAAGSYEVAIYVSQHDADAQYGLVSYGREAHGSALVTVTDTEEPRIGFLSDSLTIGGEAVSKDYYLLTDTSVTSAGITISNDTVDTPAVGSITWELYEGLTAQPGNLVAQEERAIGVIPGRAKTMTFDLKHVLENPEELHDTWTNQQLEADAYVLRATLTLDGEVVEQISYPLVRNEAALTADEPILEYLMIDPEYYVVTACASYVMETFRDVSAEEVVALTLRAERNDEIVAEVTERLVALEYQQNGIFESHIVAGLRTFLDLKTITAGEYELTAVLETGIDQESFSLPKHLIRTTNNVVVPLSCTPEMCQKTDAVNAEPHGGAKQPISLSSFMVAAAGFIIALILIVMAAHTLKGARKTKKDPEEDVSEEGEFFEFDQSDPSDQEK